MPDTMDVNLPPPPAKVDGRSREARRRREEEKAVPQQQVRSEAPIPRDDQVRARPTRAETEGRARRRRENVDKTRDMKLGIRFDLDPNYEYRWVLDGPDDQRLKRLTIDDDWEVVNNDGEPSDSPGNGVRRAVGERSTGFKYQYLCRKPKDWYEQDHRKGQERNNRMMNHIRQGVNPMDATRSLGTADHVYGQNDIRMEDSRTGS
jgi:hypothetical protein